MGQISHEPSMEDILASIKRIIAEDSEAAGVKPVRPRRDPAIAANEEEAEAPRAYPRQPLPRIEADLDEANDADPADVLELSGFMVPEPAPHAPAAAPIAPEGDLMSDPARQASRNAFAALSQKVTPRAEATGGLPIEAFVADLLRPMLSDWLDRELPGIVERLVAAEIQKVSGRD